MNKRFFSRLAHMESENSILFTTIHRFGFDTHITTFDAQVIYFAFHLFASQNYERWLKKICLYFTIRLVFGWTQSVYFAYTFRAAKYMEYEATSSMLKKNDIFSSTFSF